MPAKQCCRCLKWNVIKKLTSNAYSWMHDLLEKEGETADLQNGFFMCNSCRTYLARTRRKQTITADTENRDEDMKVDSNGDDTLKI